MGVELDSSFHAKRRCRLKPSENTSLTRIRGLSQIITSWLRAFTNHFQGDKKKKLDGWNTQRSRESGKFKQDFNKCERNGIFGRCRNRWEDYTEIDLEVNRK